MSAKQKLLQMFIEAREWVDSHENLADGAIKLELGWSAANWVSIEELGKLSNDVLRQMLSRAREWHDRNYDCDLTSEDYWSPYQGLSCALGAGELGYWDNLPKEEVAV